MKGAGVVSEFVQGPIDYVSGKPPRRSRKPTHPEVFDSRGYMKFNPDFHSRHGKPFTESDNEYICKFAEVDGFSTIGYALGRTASACQRQYYELRKQGLAEHYKSLNKHWV